MRAGVACVLHGRRWRLTRVFLAGGNQHSSQGNGVSRNEFLIHDTAQLWHTPLTSISDYLRLLLCPIPFSQYGIVNAVPLAQPCVSRVIQSDKPETGRAFGTVPPAATQPWLMTMQSSTPVWEEALVFAESYRRLLAPETLVLFELVDFAMTLSRKEARKVSFVKLVCGGSSSCTVAVTETNTERSTRVF